MIELISMGKTYKNDGVETEVLKDISLKIEDGEFVAIMGASGAGKSTLLKIIGIMDTLTDGKYFLDGNEIGSIKRKQLDQLRKDNMSFIFQNFALMKERSVYENVELPLIAKKVKVRERKNQIRMVLEKLEIADLEKKKITHISGGQQQRCAIARAIVSGNPYILADEPTGAVDSRKGQEIVQILRKLAEDGKTVIMVTHDERLAGYADRIIRILDGRIQ
jgi:putative ABC transport system ATP-binding protein